MKTLINKIKSEYNSLTSDEIAGIIIFMIPVIGATIAAIING